MPRRDASSSDTFAPATAAGSTSADIDLSMFYHADTEKELVSLRSYLQNRKKICRDDMIDRWIAMVATNRLTGHSRGFFSVYTLPPNQAVSQKSQQRINTKRMQEPEYRDTHRIILAKTKSLLRTVSGADGKNLVRAGKKAVLLTGDARHTREAAARLGERWQVDTIDLAERSR